MGPSNCRPNPRMHDVQSTNLRSERGRVWVHSWSSILKKKPSPHHVCSNCVCYQTTAATRMLSGERNACRIYSNLLYLPIASRQSTSVSEWCNTHSCLGEPGFVQVKRSPIQVPTHARRCLAWVMQTEPVFHTWVYTKTSAAWRRGYYEVKTLQSSDNTGLKPTAGCVESVHLV